MLSWWNFGPACRHEGKNPIAVCEAAMIPLALSACKGKLWDREVLFFVDNSVALHSMVKGGSNQESVARCAHLVGFYCLKKGCRVWFDFVDSKSNWADSISRRLDKCEFCKRRGISTYEVRAPLDWWVKDLREARKMV